MTDLRKEGVVVAVAGAICALVLLLLVVLDVVGSAFYDTPIGYWTVRRIAIVFYVGAIGMLAFAGFRIAQGKGFGEIMPRLLSWAGILLAVGATYETFGVAWVLRTFEIEGFRGYVMFDPTYVALGAVGLLLWLLGRLMRRAVDIARELEEFL